MKIFWKILDFKISFFLFLGACGFFIFRAGDWQILTGLMTLPGTVLHSHMHSPVLTLLDDRIAPCRFAATVWVCFAYFVLEENCTRSSQVHVSFTTLRGGLHSHFWTVRLRGEKIWGTDWNKTPRPRCYLRHFVKIRIATYQSYWSRLAAGRQWDSRKCRTESEGLNELGADASGRLLGVQSNPRSLENPSRSVQGWNCSGGTEGIKMTLLLPKRKSWFENWSGIRGIAQTKPALSAIIRGSAPFCLTGRSGGAVQAREKEQRQGLKDAERNHNHHNHSGKLISVADIRWIVEDRYRSICRWGMHHLHLEAYSL